MKILLFSAIDLPAIPFRGSNYAITNHTSAKFVDVIFTTISPSIPFPQELAALAFHVGYFEVVADCVYYVNPKSLFTEQPPCARFPVVYGCSHAFSTLVFISAYSGRCLYRYEPCPEYLGIPSNSKIGFTRLNCADHPFLSRTCIRTSSNPLVSC